MTDKRIEAIKKILEKNTLSWYLADKLDWIETTTKEIQKVIEPEIAKAREQIELQVIMVRNATRVEIEQLQDKIKAYQKANKDFQDLLIESNRARQVEKAEARKAVMEDFADWLRSQSWETQIDMLNNDWQKVTPPGTSK